MPGAGIMKCRRIAILAYSYDSQHLRQVRNHTMLRNTGLWGYIESCDRLCTDWLSLKASIV